MKLATTLIFLLGVLSIVSFALPLESLPKLLETRSLNMAKEPSALGGEGERTDTILTRRSPIVKYVKFHGKALNKAFWTRHDTIWKGYANEAPARETIHKAQKKVIKKFERGEATRKERTEAFKTAIKGYWGSFLKTYHAGNKAFVDVWTTARQNWKNGKRDPNVHI
jgi:hypothetical protein